MKTKILLSVYFVFLLLIGNKKAQAQANQTDSLALVDLYNSTNGPNWKHSDNWLTSQPLSTWRGVHVSNGQVVSLSLSSNRLKGTLPASIGNFKSITSLSLNVNQLTGPFPVSLGNLVTLTSLDLSSNLFSDTLPSSLGNLVKLTTLSMNYNKISGKLPASICNLTRLQILGFELNNLTGSLPANIGNLRSLVEMDLGENQFTGAIPMSFYSLPNIRNIYLYFNQLSDTLSEAIGNLTKLQFIYLDHNQFTGNIPSSFGNMKKIQTIFLSYNQFSGKIPGTFADCSNLVELYLTKNNLSGSLPAALANAPKLGNIYAEYNNLSGDIPPVFFDSSGIGGLTLSHNHLSSSKNFHNDKLGKTVGFVNVTYNDYNFNGLEFIATKVLNPFYSPQAQIKLHKNNGKLSVTAGGTLKNNTYYWFKVGRTDSLTITGDSTYQPTVSGKYYAKVRNVKATALTLYTDTVSVSVQAVAASNKTHLSAYPNPVHNTLTVQGLDGKTNYAITIADVNGNVLIQAAAKHQQVFTYNISLLNQGAYVVHVNGDNSEQTSIQFMKE